MTSLSESDVRAATQRLQERRRALIAEIRHEMEADGDQRTLALRDQIDQLDLYDDDAVTDLIRDVGLAQILRDTRELDEVESALRRVADGTYGQCITCGEPIPRARLEINPAAARCVPCQAREESREGTRVSI